MPTRMSQALLGVKPNLRGLTLNTKCATLPHQVPSCPLCLENGALKRGVKPLDYTGGAWFNPPTS